MYEERGSDSSSYPWEFLFDEKFSSHCGYVTSSLKLNELLEEYEYATSSRFRCLKSEKQFGKIFEISKVSDPQVRLWDTQGNADPYIRNDGIPFIIMGKKVLECHQGFDRDSKTNQRKKRRLPASDHIFKHKRRLVQNTKKKGCPVRIKIRHVVKFLNFKVKDQDQPSRKFVPSVKKDLNDGTGELECQPRFYVSFPPAEDHRNHLKGAASSILQPMDKRISNYIKKVVSEHGVTSTLKMKLLIEVFLKQSIFLNSPLPPKHNKRYWPSLKDIYNHMASQFLKLRDSSFDQKEVQGMIEEQRSIHQEDRYYLRIKTDQDQEHPVSGDPDERLFVDEDLFIGNYRKSGDGVNKFLYVHQTAWQRQLLNRYGNEICLLDATYRTTRYTLPLYFLCVPTNVNYMTVATFIVETEDSVSIQEALSIIKSWNPNWKPAYFMCDYADEEISSIESVFPESFVYLCDFHREQAWERWLKATHNGIGDDKDEILSLLRSVARSKTNEEFELSSNRLKNSHFWTENNRFRKWFEGRWLNKYKRWVQAFRQKRYNTSVNTNNGVERQNKTLKYEFLEAKKAKSLCHLLTILWNDFLPDIYQRYVKLNLISAEESMRYNPDIPTFLINRPRNVVKHCFKRWEEAGNISVDDIDSLGEDQFLVKSQVPESSQVYCVRFSAPDFPVPSCDCEDWAKHHLPCKHFFAVIRNVTGWQWEKLPEEYRNNPFLTLDESVLYEFSSPSYVTHPDCKEDQESRRETNTDSNIQEIILPSKSRLSKIRSNISSYCQMIRDYSYSCKDEEILETLGSKLKDTLDGLTTSLSETDVLPVDNPQKQMTHIATTPAKRINKLSLSKKRNKGVGRHGSSAENMRKHTSKGVHDLLSHESSEVAEEIITIEDDQYSHLEANGMKGILKKMHKGTKQVKKVHFPDSGTMSQTVTKYHEMDYREALEEVNKIWNMEKGTGFFIGKVTNFNITDEDIRSLDGTNWVTDQVIDAYLAAIVQKEIEKGNKVALYPSQTMTQIMDGNFSVGKSRRKLKLYECTSIIGAICKNCHWTLVIVDPLKGFIHYFNPLKETRIQIEEIKRNWCLYISERMVTYHELERRNWAVITREHSKQTDSFNCGVYCLIFAERYFNQQPCDKVSNADLKSAREKIATSLMMYNVYSTDRCPCCGFLTYAEETITCELCSRKFHRTEACLGSGCMSLETITCRMCSLKFQEKPSKRKSDDGEIGNEKNLKKWKTMENAKSDVLFTRNGPDQNLEASGKNAKFHVNSNGYDLVENLWSLEKDFNFPVANVFGKVIMDTDIRSLKSNECLTDRVIDCYLLLLATQQNELGRNVVHYDQTKMTGIINSDFLLPDVSQNSGIDVEADVIVGVYHRSYHWTLVIVEVREGKIFFYNPCGERSHEMKKIERSWRKYDSEYRNKYQISNKSPDWKICTSPHALQRDSFNCGIYCLVFAEKHLNGHLHDLQSITKKDLQIMRRKVALELMLYKVNLTGCCPKCAKKIENEEKIECSMCQRAYHFKPFCIEEDMDLEEFTEFKCRMCRINFWGKYEADLESVNKEVAKDCPTLSYDLRKHPKKKKKRTSFLYPDVRGRYLPVKEETLSTDDCKLTCETENQTQSENMGKEGTGNDEEEVQDAADVVTQSSVFDTDYINSHLNSVIGALTKIMNCKIDECDEADHARHHMFVKSPADMYDKYIKQYFFGRKFLSSQEQEHLQTVLQEEMFCSKPLPGSIFTRYRTFQTLENEELESILIDSPLMAVHYFSFILLKEAMVYLICNKTGLPYEEADARCSSTECSVKDFHL